MHHRDKNGLCRQAGGLWASRARNIVRGLRRWLKQGEQRVT